MKKKCSAFICTPNGTDHSIRKCNNGIDPSERVCSKHTYYGLFTDDQLEQIDKFIKGDKTTVTKICDVCNRFTFEIINNGKISPRCSNCVQQYDVIKNQQKLKYEKRKKGIKCNWYDKTGNPCPYYCDDHEIYCDTHSYVNEYTDDQRKYENCGSCGTCHLWIYKGEYNSCEKCRQLGSINREKKKQNRVICKKPKCPFEVAIDGKYPDYCGLHQRYAKKFDVDIDVDEKQCKSCGKAVSIEDNKSLYCLDCLIRLQYQNYLIEYFEKSASKRNIGFNLEPGYVFKLIYNECYYCGGMSERGFNGIDRFDNSILYTTDNSVPCCWVCNKMKKRCHGNKILEYCNNILIEYGKLVRWTGPPRTHMSYADYKYNAKHKNQEFKLTIDEFNEITSYNCYYCQGKNCINHIGVDRLNSLKYYQMDNCVPACSVCNMLKSDLSVDILLKQLQKIKEKNKINSLSPSDFYNYYNKTVVTPCLGYFKDKNPCKNKCSIGVDYCVHHKYYEMLVEKNIDKLAVCNMCDRYHENKTKFCNRCTNDNSTIQVIRDNNSAICSSVSNTNTNERCRYQKEKNSSFCKHHAHLDIYTDEELLKLSKCRGCRKIKYIQGQASCNECMGKTNLKYVKKKLKNRLLK